MSQLVYKLFRQSEWHVAMRSGMFAGSDDDRRDGFIHLSAPGQVRATFKKYFANEADPVLVAFAAESLGPTLKWEPSRGGALFPHFYGILDMGTAVATAPIRREQGAPVFPREIP